MGRACVCVCVCVGVCVGVCVCGCVCVCVWGGGGACVLSQMVCEGEHECRHACAFKGVRGCLLSMCAFMCIDKI